VVPPRSIVPSVYLSGSVPLRSASAILNPKFHNSAMFTKRSTTENQKQAVTSNVALFPSLENQSFTRH